VRVLDAILFILLLVGNGLALPIWGWLFGTPLLRISTWCLTRMRGLRPPVKITPTRAGMSPSDCD
jgi:hypothetical protein